jgi:hypothetical protein
LSTKGWRIVPIGVEITGGASEIGRPYVHRGQESLMVRNVNFAGVYHRHEKKPLVLREHQ